MLLAIYKTFCIALIVKQCVHMFCTMFCRLIQNLLLVDMKRPEEPQKQPRRLTLLVLSLALFLLLDTWSWLLWSKLQFMFQQQRTASHLLHVNYYLMYRCVKLLHVYSYVCECTDKCLFYNIFC